MTDIVRIFLILFSVAAGAYLYRRNRSAAARVGSAIAMGTTVSVVLLGLTIVVPAFRYGVHGYLGHVLIAAGWLVILFATGIAASRGFARRRWTVVLDVPLLLAILSGILFSGITGYLNPPLPPTDAFVTGTARLRFLVLHVTGIPVLTIALSLIAYFRFRRFQKESA